MGKIYVQTVMYVVNKKIILVSLLERCDEAAMGKFSGARYGAQEAYILELPDSCSVTRDPLSGVIPYL